ncbi:lissencephaly-1 homolog [Plakobranchus ocellatus]|uniref:Lissencephaly-1 homolog n=1 Tax=Plakobranchus ocellatus TaxID=259542 RepID=A0AAV4A9E1_9GAST|nr:lissencephaly-1 homolog [Plakobranchus ocellatus]
MIGGDTAGRLCFWSLGSGKLEAAVRGHEDAVTRVRFQGGRFFSASCDSTIKEWDLRTMTCLRVLRGHRGPVRDVQVGDFFLSVYMLFDHKSTPYWGL